MKKMKKVLFLMFLLFLLVLGTATVNAQVKIGSNAVPTAGAVLDLNAPSGYVGGLLLPNVQLTDLSSFPASFTSATTINGSTAIKTALAGLLVYNTGGTYTAGVYVWDGTTWKRLNAV
jgi:hypothetical protein